MYSSLLSGAELELRAKRANAQNLLADLNETRRRAAMGGARALTSPKTVAELEQKQAAYTAAAEAVATAEHGLVRLAAALADTDELRPSAFEAGLNEFCRTLAGWRDTLSDGQLSGHQPFNRSPDMVLAKRGSVRAALLKTANYPSVAQRAPSVIPLPGAPLTLLDLMTVVETDAQAFAAVQETVATSGAAETAEGNAAAESTLEYDVIEGSCKWIATAVPLVRSILTDDGLVRNFIRQTLLRLVRQRLQSQAIAGDGVAPNLLGLLERDGLQTLDTTGLAKGTAVRRAITKVHSGAEGWEPDVFLVHPLDAQRYDLDVDAAGELRIDPRLTSWRSPVWGLVPIVSSAVPEGSPLVGAASSLELYLREDFRVSISSEHSDFFTKGKVMMLGNVRADLHVAAPAAWVKLDSYES
jgi:HK97 family phage major capsid protein